MAIIAVGDETTRRKWIEKLSVLGSIIPTLIHPTVFIPEGVVVGSGTVICARSTISTGVTIGRRCIVTSGSTVPRKTTIPDYGYFDFDKVIHYREIYKINEKANEEVEQ